MSDMLKRLEPYMPWIDAVIDVAFFIGIVVVCIVMLAFHR